MIIPKHLVLLIKSYLIECSECKFLNFSVKECNDCGYTVCEDKDCKDSLQTCSECYETYCEDCSKFYSLPEYRNILYCEDCNIFVNCTNCDKLIDPEICQNCDECSFSCCESTKSCYLIILICENCGSKLCDNCGPCSCL